MNIKEVTHVVIDADRLSAASLRSFAPGAMTLVPGEPLLPAATPAQLELCAWSQQRVRAIYETARTFANAVRSGVWHAPSSHRQQQHAARLSSIERQARGLPY